MVIGTAGGAAKVQFAAAHGCDHVIDYKSEDFTQRVKEITGGQGVSVVYDGIGKDTFMGSLDALEPFGHMVTYGNASGPVDPISPLLLTQKGSLTLSRPSLITFATLPVLRRAAAKALFEVVAKGAVTIEIGQTYALKDVGKAQDDLAARKTTGSTVLIP
jgi:NADPH2:quinone reductase